MVKKEAVVISLGGSILVPEEVDVSFVREFKQLIEKESKKRKIIVIVGGGKTARKYIEAGRKITKNISNDNLDWIGIHATRLNAQLLKNLISGANRVVQKNPKEKLSFNKILIAAGWKPGFSTDYDAVLLAKTYKAEEILNITNVDYVYDKNPKTNKKAKKFTNLTWKEMRKIIGGKWKPGLNSPFDPLACKEAEKSKIKVVVIGKDIQNLKKFFAGKKFRGTIIK